MGLARLYYDVELPLADVLGEIEDIGMPVDAGTLEEVGEDLDGRIADVEKLIYEDVGHPFNIGSPKQLGEVLFEEMEIPPVRKTKTGYSTDAKVLQQLAIQHPVADRIIEYRELTKLRGTYIDGLIKLITDEGRIHSTLQQTRAATGRLSSDSPNLQNIPIRTEMGVRIRDAFTASPGRRLVVADYSQIELRILAHMTGEPSLVESFVGGEISRARLGSFRRAYGERYTRAQETGQDGQLRHPVRHLGVRARNEARERAPGRGRALHQALLRALPEGHRVHAGDARRGRGARVLDDALRQAAIRSRAEELQQERQEAGERIAFNARVQGTAADIIKVAMVDLAPRLGSLGADMIMQVHDELVFDVDEDSVEEVADLAVDRMVAAYDLEPPLEVEAKAGDRWGRVHPL